MSIFKNLLSKLFNKKSEVNKVTLQQEITVLNQMVETSLINGDNSSVLSPDNILIHTAKVKKIVIRLYDDGQLKMDRKTLDYLLTNIATQENMITSSGKGYGITSPDIYNSQVGSSIMEILKDIQIFVN